MASANGSPESSAAAVPQWKRDLIQRRRQQNKVFTSNGASGKLCSAVTGTFANDSPSSAPGDSQPAAERNAASGAEEHQLCSGSCELSDSCQQPIISPRASGATAGGGNRENQSANSAQSPTGGATSNSPGGNRENLSPTGANSPCGNRENCFTNSPANANAACGNRDNYSTNSGATANSSCGTRENYSSIIGATANSPCGNKENYLSNSGASCGNRENSFTNSGATANSCGNRENYLTNSGASCGNRDNYLSNSGASCGNRDNYLSNSGASCGNRDNYLSNSGASCGNRDNYLGNSGASCGNRDNYLGNSGASCGNRDNYLSNSGASCGNRENCLGNSGATAKVSSGNREKLSPSGVEGASSFGCGNGGVPSVVCNMRLEADACPSSEDAPKCTARNNQHAVVASAMERAALDFENYENEDALRNYANSANACNKLLKSANNKEQDSENRTSRIIKRMDKESSVCIFSEQTRKSRIEKMAGNGNKSAGDECESDSSEELQYGPGIVNRLKSKYLNLTLREMNKSRNNVQRFRRAASLEDLLDCDDDPEEKADRKFAKRNAPGVATKTDRYRNANRGNESMKRARSVETLMRYNSPLVAEESLQSNKFANLRQEPVNDHIVLIDRTTVKIESRLIDPDRPKAVNKPKRIKPLLAETERPPPDLVKTTMRIFEGSVKKFKPKGEVAVKVATFKTINDTYKAQAMKKVVPKPPIQPKPFVNGNSKPPGSPKKILVPQIPTAELIEKPEVLEEYRNDGVVTDPIVQSVSSVVSKFQQIEKSHSPSQSPEPTYKLKFSPAPSPEPPAASKLKSSGETLIKSPPVTPVPSPRISSPGAPSPASPKRDLLRQNSSPVHQPSSPSRELFRQASAPEVPKNLGRSEDNEAKEAEDSRQPEAENQSPEIVREESKPSGDDLHLLSSFGETSDASECVDGSRTISKIALENISKAGSTVQFNFGDKTSAGKSYLPGAPTQNGQKSEAIQATNGLTETQKHAAELKISPPVPENCSSPLKNMETSKEQVTRLQERLESEKSMETKTERSPSPNVQQPEYNKPIGAISSLALIKSSPTTTTTSYPQSNESKTIRSQKSDSSPPQKQIGIIRPLVSTKTQIAQQNLSNRELEKNLINRVKSIEQPTKVVVSLKSADEIQPVKKTTTSPGSGGGGGGGLWDTKPWNQANNTMVFNFSNRKDVPDYIENDGLIIRRKREKTKVGDGGVIVLDATLDASTTDDSDWEISGGPPSPCDVSFTNDNVLINGRSNLSKQPRNHKHRIQFDDGATRTFEYPSEASMLEDEGTSVDGDSSSAGQQSSQGANKSSSGSSASTMSSALLGGGGLASFTPSKVDLASEGFELGVTRTTAAPSAPAAASEERQGEDSDEYLKSDEDAAAWGAEATADLLY